MNLGQKLKDNGKGKGPVYSQWEYARYQALQNSYTAFKKVLKEDIEVRGFSAPLTYYSTELFSFDPKRYSFPRQESVRHLLEEELLYSEERDWRRSLKSHGLAMWRVPYSNEYAITPWGLADTVSWYTPRKIRSFCRALFG